MPREGGPSTLRISAGKTEASDCSMVEYDAVSGRGADYKRRSLRSCRVQPVHFWEWWRQTRTSAKARGALTIAARHSVRGRTPTEPDPHRTSCECTYPGASNSDLAACKSAVSVPSVNQPQTGAS